MKTLVFFVLCFVFPLLLTANFVQNQPYEHIQPDGTKLNLYVTGDEYYHRVHDERNYTILKHPETGYAVYAVPDGNSIKVSDYVVGQSDPAVLGIQSGLFKRSELKGSIRW